MYPCTKSGKMLKGFCLTVCDLQGMSDTLFNWKRFSSKFGISYYCISIYGSEFVVNKL